MNAGAQITADEVRFIKLGRGGAWEKDCIESSKVRFGWNNPHHEACLKDDWPIVEAYWRKERPPKATEIINQIRDFYTLGSNALWVTFYKRKLYWCFADPQIVLQPDGSRTRRAIDGWTCTDVSGQKTLFIDSLSGRFTKMQRFPGTMCKVYERAYLLRRINGNSPPEVEQAGIALTELTNAIKPLIQALYWKDFELLVDMIFSRSGWQRMSRLGETEKSIDLDLMMPFTGRRAFVQVKSTSNLDELRNYIAQYRTMEQYDEMFFIVHTAAPDLRKHADGEEVIFWGIDEIAKLAVDCGLSQWLMDKAA